MNIGIVTVPDSANCGSFLQAYGMKTFLESTGNNVIFVRTRSEEYVRNLFYDKSLFIRSIIKWPIIGVRRWEFWRKNYAIFSEAWRTYLKIQDDDIDSFDVILLGSDEIWNVRTEVFNKPIFYGYGKENTVAYAVSAGRATIDDYKDKKDIVNYISKLHTIFPRDENTKNIIYHYTCRQTDCVCDPTLLIDWETIPSSFPEELEGIHYLMIYAYSVTDEMKRNIQKYAKREKLVIVSVGFFFMWADLNISINPLQLYIVCKKAEIIVTETFHGTIFATLSGTPFLSFPTGSKSKVFDFLDKAGCVDRIIDSKAEEWEFEDKLRYKVNTDKINCFVKKYRDYSSVLLLNALEEALDVSKKE